MASYVRKYDPGERLTDLADINYIERILKGELSIMSVQFSRGNNGKTFFYCLNLNLKDGDNKEVYSIYHERLKLNLYVTSYNALYRLVEDVIRMPISEFTDRKFDYL